MWQKEYSVQQSARDFMYKVYGWMSVALTISGAVAYFVASTPSIYMTFFKSPILVFGIALIQIGLVMFLASQINRLSYSEAVTMFLLYAALVGVTTSSVLIVYTFSSVFLAFGITAGLFSSMALYGYFTGADLTSMGSTLIMGLWGIILAMFLNMWFQSPEIQYWISVAAVGIFTLLTAYDSQKIKQLAHSLGHDQETKNKVAIMGALTLYLDFINLFLHLVRLLGKRK